MTLAMPTYFTERISGGHRDQSSDSSRGAALVEFALVAVVLFTIIFGLIEGGLLVRARNAVNNSADEAARRGAIAGSSISADWMVLQQLRQRGTLSAAAVNYVVVYRADGSTSDPNATCEAGTPVAGECNVYERADFELPRAAFDCSDAALDGSWCPADRAVDGTEFSYIGVYIDADHRGMTGVFGDIGLIAQSALPIEGSGSNS